MYIYIIAVHSMLKMVGMCTHLLLILVLVFTSHLGARHSDLVCTAGHQTPTLPPLPRTASSHGFHCCFDTGYQDQVPSKLQTPPGSRMSGAASRIHWIHWIHRIHWSHWNGKDLQGPQVAVAVPLHILPKLARAKHDPPPGRNASHRYGHCEGCASGRSPIAATWGKSGATWH